MKRANAYCNVAGRRLKGITTERRGGFFLATISCSKCPTTDNWRAASIPGPEIVVAHFRRKNWEPGKNALCPTCRTARAKTAPAAVPANDTTPVVAVAMPETPPAPPAPPTTEPVLQPALKITEVLDMASQPASNVTPLPTSRRVVRPTGSDKPLPSEEARSKRREASALIDAEFDIENGRYRPGCSDAEIANTVGLSVSTIVGIREQFYGPLLEPDDLAAAREDVEAARKTLTSISERLATATAAAKETKDIADRALAEVRRAVDVAEAAGRKAAAKNDEIAALRNELSGARDAIERAENRVASAARDMGIAA